MHNLYLVGVWRYRKKIKSSFRKKFNSKLFNHQKLWSLFYIDSHDLNKQAWETMHIHNSLKCGIAERGRLAEYSREVLYNSCINMVIHPSYYSIKWFMQKSEMHMHTISGYYFALCCKSTNSNNQLQSLWLRLSIKNFNFKILNLSINSNKNIYF